MDGNRMKLSKKSDSITFFAMILGMVMNRFGFSSTADIGGMSVLFCRFILYC